MSLNQEFHWDTLFNKYDKIEKDLLKIMENAQKSNDYTVKKLNALIKENRTFECELMHMNKELTNIVEKLKEECTSTDVKQKLKKGIRQLKKYITKGIKKQTSEGNIKVKTKQKKTEIVKVEHETNLSYSQNSINIKDSDSEMGIRNMSTKFVKNRYDVSKEIEEKEKQIYDTINWAYEKMKLFENNIEKQDLIQDATNTETKNVVVEEEKCPNRKGIILNQLKFMHENLKDELVELQKNQDHLNNTNTANWTNNVGYEVEDVDSKQIKSFSGFMTEVLSQLTSFHHKLITENDNSDQKNSITQKEEVQTKSKKELLYILKDTSDIMKTLFSTITEKFIDNNVGAAFKREIEESKINETNESIQHILNQLISTFENTEHKEERASMSFSKQEVLEQFKITYENMKEAYNRTIQDLRENEIEVDVKVKSVKVKPSKIPKYKRTNLPKQLDNRIVETKLIEEDEDLEESCLPFNEKSKERLLEQLNSTYDTMTSEYEVIKQKLKEDSLESGNNDEIKDRENGMKKSKIGVQDILKQLKNTYEDMKNEYKAVVQNLNDRSLEDKITEEELLLQKLEKVKQNKQEILHRLKSISGSVKDSKQNFDKKQGKSKKRRMKNIYTKLDNKKEKCLKKPKRFKRLSAKLKYYNMKDDYTQYFTENVCGHFITKHVGTEKSKLRVRLAESIKDNKCKKFNSEKSCSKMMGNKLEQPMSRYERVKKEYMQHTTNTEDVLKRINQIEEKINFLETNIKKETSDKKVFKQLKLIYTDLKEKYNYYAAEKDILNTEITALKYDKTNIEKDMRSLEMKIENFKTNKSKFTRRMLLTDLESTYEDLRQNFNRRITSEETKLVEKITKFINDGKNLEKMIKLLETRVNEYENGISDVIIELELNYNILKKQYKQIISEDIKEDKSSVKNVRKKIEKEMDNIESKLKTLKIGDTKSHVLKQKVETTNSQTVEEKSNILNMKTQNDIIITRSNNFINDYEFIYIKEEQVQTTDDKENQTHIKDSITKILEDVTTSTALINDEDITAIACDIELHVPEKKDNEKVNTSLQTEEVSSRIAKNKCVFTETDKVAENISKNEEKLVEDGILKMKEGELHKRMDDCNVVGQLNLIIDEIEVCDSKKVEVIMDESNPNYYGKYIKGDEIIRKAEDKLSRLDEELNEDMTEKGGDIVKIAEEQLSRLDKELKEDMAEKGDDIVKTAEEQLDRIERYLRTNDCPLRKVDECKGIKFEWLESNKIRNKSKNTVEQMKNIDLKELILLHENMVKCDKKKFEEKFKDIRQLKSVLKMQFKGREEAVRGQESGDKSIDFNEKLKVVQLPNQSLCGYRRVDLEDGIDKDIGKVPQKVESVFKVDYVNYQHYDSVQTNKLKMILKAEKETFKELKQVLIEKSDRLENINDILKRLLESTADSNLNKEENGIKQNRGDTTIHSKQWNLKIVSLPSQNVKPETTNESITWEKNQEFLNFTKHGYNVESEKKIEKEMIVESNEKLELEAETNSLKRMGSYKNVAYLEKRIKTILDSMAPEDIYKMQAYLKKSPFPEKEISGSNNDFKNVFQENKAVYHFDVVENKSDEIFELKKEIAELKLEDRQREDLLSLQQFEGLFKGNTNKHNQKKYLGLLNNPIVFEDDIKKKNTNRASIEQNRDGKGWFEMSAGKNNLRVDEKEFESRTIQYDEIFGTNEESKKINSITILCKNRFGSSEHLLEDNYYLEKIIDKYENQKLLIKDMVENNFNAENELVEMRIKEFLKKEESSVILEEPMIIKNQIKENKTQNLLRNSDSERFQLKGNIILKDEVASKIWETVIGRDYDISIFNHDKLSSRPKEITKNDLFHEQKTSFDTDLLYPRSSFKSKENEEEMRVREVDKSAVLNEEEEEADLMNTVTYSSEIVSLDVISEEMFIDSHSFES